MLKKDVQGTGVEGDGCGNADDTGDEELASTSDAEAPAELFDGGDTPESISSSHEPDEEDEAHLTDQFDCIDVGHPIQQFRPKNTSHYDFTNEGGTAESFTDEACEQ